MLFVFVFIPVMFMVVSRVTFFSFFFFHFHFQIFYSRIFDTHVIIVGETKFVMLRFDLVTVD